MAAATCGDGVTTLAWLERCFCPDLFSQKTGKNGAESKCLSGTWSTNVPGTMNYKESNVQNVFTIIKHFHLSKLVITPPSLHHDYKSTYPLIE